MGFSQLYYTSCERGLAGHPGLQFNAATPGVRPEVMTAVEEMTGYEPPPSLAYGASAAAIATAPVNLCYQPGTTKTPATMLAQVAFVGTDYSRRFGNYFAHTLVTSNPADFGEVLPIELWGSALWTREPVDDPDLPVLGGLTPGGLDRDAVAAFVTAHRGERHLPALLTAIDLALRPEGRRVVVVERDAAAVAAWIAAASYLLPRESVRRMSFATYEHQPRFSGMHVVGTLAESEVSRAAFDTYHLFDFVADEISQIDVHPMAAHLAYMGVESAELLWRQARELADGSEEGLDGWYPVVMADAGTDAVVVAPWLAAHARRLEAETVERIGSLLDVSGCSLDALARLAQATEAVGATGFAEQVELAWARKFIETAPSGGTLPVRSVPARQEVAVALAERLPLADARAAAALLHWAEECAIRVPDDVQHQTGARAIGPAVWEEGAEAWLVPLLRSWPGVRGGVVAHISASVHNRLSDVIGLLSSELAPLLRLREDGGLAVAVLLADVKTGRIQPVHALARLALSGQVQPDVLILLWPDGWTHHDALLLLDNVEKSLFCRPPLLQWLNEALLSPASGGDTYERLCAKVLEEPVVGVLPRETVKQVNARFEAASLVDGMVRARSEQQFGHAMDEFIGVYRGTRNERRRGELMTVLVDKAAEVPPEWFALLYARLQDVRDAYRSAAQPSLDPRQADPAVAADLLTVARYLGDVVGVRGINAMRMELHEQTLPAVRKWPRPLVRQVVELLRRRGPQDLARWFADESRAFAGNPLARFLLGQMRSRERRR
ncbi:GTPase-associated protein 1-related protein [Lentzea cavernae]|nr:GTPase-associated protein 1-related protein [Lentzea cavernae]